MRLKARTRRHLWDAVTIIAVGGIIYGSFEFIEYNGPWKALVYIPLMLVLGWMAVQILYPMWFRD